MAKKSAFPEAGTPSRRKRMDYMNVYTRAYYVRRTLMFDRRKPEDMKVVEKLNALPTGTRNEFIRRALAEKFGIE